MEFSGTLDLDKLVQQQICENAANLIAAFLRRTFPKSTVTMSYIVSGMLDAHDVFVDIFQ